MLILYLKFIELSVNVMALLWITIIYYSMIPYFLKKSNLETFHNIKMPQLLPEQVEQNVTLQPQLESSDQTLHYSVSTSLAGLSPQQYSASIASTPSPQSVPLTHPQSNCPLTVDSQTFDRSRNKTKHDAVQTIGKSDSLSIGMFFSYTNSAVFHIIITMYR